MTRERTLYLNGEFLPESQGRISVNDQGFVHGDAAFDTSRTFNGTVFKLHEHIDRLYQSLKYLRMDPKMTKDRMATLTTEVVERNAPLLAPNEDYWVTQRVTRGVPSSDGSETLPTVIILCRPLPLRERARFFRDGVRLMTSSIRRTPPWALSPQAKTHNYLNVGMADLEVKDRDPDAWVMLLDERGNLSEGSSNNLFLVKDGVLYTPRRQMVLAGVTRQTVLDLAATLNIPAQEKDMDLYEAYCADEMFITSSSLCICPVTSINSIDVGSGKIPGPVTGGLMAAFSEMVGMDYVSQYTAHL